MFKKCLLLLMLCFALPSTAGEVETALDRGDNVFLYLYSPRCKYCTMFNPTYDKLTKSHNGQYSFLKINTDAMYGKRLLYKYNGSYVPYVVLINKQKNKTMHVVPACLLESVCIETEMKQFRM